MTAYKIDRKRIIEYIALIELEKNSLKKKDVNLLTTQSHEVSIAHCVPTKDHSDFSLKV